MKETFKRKAITVGSSTGCTFPKYLSKSGKVEKGKEYEITVSDEAAEDGRLQ